ncbi:hypothetical protein ACLB2K_035484 [Fragaria x ananassa]
MDKSWIEWGTRCSKPHYDKLDEFLSFASASRDISSRIYCPCRKCENRDLFVIDIVREHLRDNGFWKKYKIWEKHGESTDYDGSLHRDEVLLGSNNYMDVDMVLLVQEALGTAHVARPGDENGGEENSDPLVGGPNEFANQPLYPGSKKHIALSFIVRILEAKVSNGWSDTSFKDLLDIFEESMPKGVNLRKSYNEAQKLTEDLGFTYYTVDACPNSYNDVDRGLELGLGPGKRRAAKQERYFPLEPRLQRLFMSSKTATLMRWHAEKRTDDGVFRHPVDSLAWKDFDSKHSNFSADIRNVRLGLASDGFNPFRTMNIPHSTWPIILVPYKLPPTLLMKQPYIYLSVLIDGPQALGDNIDVYLQPLIEELKELWEEGVPTFDPSSNQMFQLYAGLLWTINDFPAYANLSGWSTKGEYACPNCNSETDSVWLNNGHKWSFGSSRRFSPEDHKYRRDAKSFNGLREYREAPSTLSGVDLLT